MQYIKIIVMDNEPANASIDTRCVVEYIRKVVDSCTRSRFFVFT